VLKYEYKREWIFPYWTNGTKSSEIHDSEMELLSEQGQQGWELITLKSDNNGGAVYYFKRLLPIVGSIFPKRKSG